MKKILLIFSVLLLFSLLVLLMGASATKSLVIDVAEDTYVVADLNDPEDALGFMSKNYGDLDFVKAWYLWNVEVQEMTPTEEEEEETEEEVPPEEETEAEEEEEEAPTPLTVEIEKEKVVSIVYLKFDLSEIEDKTIDSAMLQLYTNNVVLVSPRYVQVFLVDSGWEETALTFNTAPQWGATATATATIYQAEQWYGWDVTQDVEAEVSSGQISFAAFLRFQDMTKASEELVGFNSRETGENAPRLLITYTEPGGTFSWYWWVIIGVVVLALIAAAFFGGLKFRRRQPPAEEK